MSVSTSVRSTFALVALSLPAASLAVRAPDQAGAMPPPRPILQATDSLGPTSDRAAGDAGLAAFRARYGGTWLARFDRRTNRPAMIWGSGIPWIPGRGNSLSWSDVTPAGAPLDREATVALLERNARQLLKEVPELFRLPAGNVRYDVDRLRSVDIGDGHVLTLVLRPTVDGVAVEGASVFFRLNSGNLVQLGTELVGDQLRQAPTAAIIDAPAALAAARARLEVHRPGAGFTQSVRNPGTLRLVPWAGDPGAYDGPEGLGLEYRLAWRVAFVLHDGFETWTADVDAVSGEVLALFDDNRYACPPPPPMPKGRVTGGIFTRGAESGPEEIRGIAHTLVANGGLVATDFDGGFDHVPGEPAETWLAGPYFALSCVDCTNPPAAFVRNIAGGDLFLGVGGRERVGNGISTRPERNVAYHLPRIRAIASHWLDDAAVGGFFSRSTPTTVNRTEMILLCNAAWDGAGLNFWLTQGPGTCNSTAELSDVAYHEWGHGIDQFAGGGNDAARGEGLGDVVAFIGTHDAAMAPYFDVGNPAGLRNADEAVRGTMTVSNSDTYCPLMGTPPERDPHCVGEVYLQAHWHLGVNLRAKAVTAGGSEAAGWRALERLFFQSLPLSDTYLPDQAGSAYDAIVLVDDDNGDLADGVPDGAEINDAFLHHEIASTPQTLDTADCAVVAPTVVTLADSIDPATERWKVDVSWTDVPGAVEYVVSRNEFGAGADVVLAEVVPPALSWTDDDVLGGVTYAYRVAARFTPGCETIGETRQSVTIPAEPKLAVAGFDMDESTGNLNLAVDPGERVGFTVRISNASTVLATAVTGTLSSPHPGVAILDGSDTFGSVAPGAIVQGTPNGFSVRFDDVLVTCGELVPLVIELESPEGCTRAGIEIRIGRQDGWSDVVTEDFETDTGWVVDPGGADPGLTAGTWERADPARTKLQPENDATPDPGVTAWVTDNRRNGTNPFDGAAFDVDGGCTVLQGPVYDLGGETGLRLRFKRLVPGFSFDDGLFTEISNDGGGAWRMLAGPEGFILDWSEAVHDLDPILGGAANQVVLRFTACDFANDSGIEALIDDVVIERPIWACEAPGARPRLSFLGSAVGDSAAQSGQGNGDGLADPGEYVRIPMDLRNTGNGLALNVRGTLRIVSGPAGIAITDATANWPVIGPGSVAANDTGTPPYFEVRIPPEAACSGEALVVAADITYTGPAGAHALTTPDITLPLGIPADVIVFEDDMETDKLWVAQSACVPPGCDPENDWQRDVPTGRGFWDPDAAHSPTMCWGTDLGRPGPANANGSYVSTIDEYLESPPIDATGQANLVLAFWRWLTVEGGEFDQARVLVNGQEVWRNPDGPPLLDEAWTYQEIDISAIADGQADVRIRFELKSDGSTNYGGWTIDDVKVVSRAFACTPQCFEAAPAPTGPVLRATGRKGDTSAEFTWTAATLGAGEWFSLYEGTRADDVSTILTPAGFSGKVFEDTDAPEWLHFYRLARTNCAGDEPLNP